MGRSIADELVSSYLSRRFADCGSIGNSESNTASARGLITVYAISLYPNRFWESTKTS